MHTSSSIPTTINVNGFTLEVPASAAVAGLTGREINHQAGLPENQVTYEILPDGHRVIPPHEKVQIQHGASFGTMNRVVAGGVVIELASVDGCTFAVPEHGQLMLPHQIKEQSTTMNKPVIYRVTPQGNEVLLPDQPVCVQPGDRFGTMNRVIAGGRNFHRINAELALLLRTRGADMVSWTPNQEWVKLQSFALPSGYNATHTEMLIHVPETYGLGVPIRECYVNTGIRYKLEGRWQKIPHYFDADDSYSPRQGVKQEGWGYFCLHCIEWGPRDNFETFLNAVFTVMSNPFYSWPT